MEGTNKAHENGEAMGFVGVRLTVMLGHGYWFWLLHFLCETAPRPCACCHCTCSAADQIVLDVGMFLSHS